MNFTRNFYDKKIFSLVNFQERKYGSTYEKQNVSGDENNFLFQRSLGRGSFGVFLKEFVRRIFSLLFGKFRIYLPRNRPPSSARKSKSRLIHRSERVTGNITQRLNSYMQFLLSAFKQILIYDKKTLNFFLF